MLRSVLLFVLYIMSLSLAASGMIMLITILNLSPDDLDTRIVFVQICNTAVGVYGLVKATNLITVKETTIK